MLPNITIIVNKVTYGDCWGDIVRKYMRYRRKELGLTQKDMAQKLGVARVTYTNIELGRKDPSLKLALRIKEVLKCSDDKIFNNYEE